MIRTSLPMYSGEPVIGSGGYRPCHGHFSIIEILSQFDRNFNQILFSWNIWKVFQNQSQNNLTKKKERLKSADFTHFSVQMSATRTRFPVSNIRYFCIFFCPFIYLYYMDFPILFFVFDFFRSKIEAAYFLTSAIILHLTALPFFLVYNQYLEKSNESLFYTSLSLPVN